MFAYQQFGIDADIMTLGKGIGGGVPLAALLARQDVSVFSHGEQGGTYNGNPLMAAVGVARVRCLERAGLPGFGAGARPPAVRGPVEAIRPSGACTAKRGAGLLRALVMDRDDGPAIVDAARASWNRKACC